MAAKQTALLLLLLAAIVAVGTYIPSVAATVPGLSGLLGRLAPWLPADMAWMHDPGSTSLRAGIYYGWSDGTEGELHLYGSGCTNPADTPTRLELRGRSGKRTVPAAQIALLEPALTGNPHVPYIRVLLTAQITEEYDRATLHCRSGTEATTRVTIRIEHVPTDRLHRATGETTTLPPPATSHARPGAHSELLITTGEGPLLVTSVTYAPRNATTDTVWAAAGRPENLPLWRTLLWNALSPRANTGTHLPRTLPHDLLDLRNVTPWHAAHQDPKSTNYLRRRPAETLDLTVQERGTAVLYLEDGAFKVTPEAVPLIVTPLIHYKAAGGSGVMLAPNPTFGQTPSFRSQRR